MSGLSIAIIGAALCAALAGCGSAIGVMAAGKAAAGVTSEKPELFGKLLVLQALPGTQGIYGFLTAILIMVQIGVLGGNAVDLTAGLAVLRRGNADGNYRSCFRYCTGQNRCRCDSHDRQTARRLR